MATKYRAEQVGSFLRPQEVLDAHRAYGEGKLPLEQLRAIEDAAILAVLDLQKQVGIDVQSDGEYRRGGWASDFQDAVGGYVPGAPPVSLQWHDPKTGAAVQPGAGAGGGGQVIGAKLSPRRHLTSHESAFVKAHATGPYKVTMPAASYVTSRGFKPGVTDQVYASRKDVLTDVAAILKAEVAALVAEGVPYIQLDNPHYPDYIDPNRREQWRALGVDHQTAILDDIAADNAVVAGVDRSKTAIAMHFCRGNGARGQWHTTGGYDFIAEQVFGGLDYDVFLLEYDSERAGGFEPLRFVPRGKTVVLGLVTTKAGELESQDLLRRRIDEAAKYVALADLALSPQCGFASTLAGNPLTWDEQRRKLELVVDTARKVWG